MKSDPLLFQVFTHLPRCFFHIINRAESDAQRYRLKAIEFKDASVRLDGVYEPLEPGTDPVYIWEAQFYASKNVYANLMIKVGHYLQHLDRAQDWVAVVIYPTKSLEQKNLNDYRCLIDSDQLLRIYLDELPKAEPDQFELGILEMIAAKPEDALAQAQTMIPLLKASNQPKPFQRILVEFIETVILHQFPTWSRKELEKMLQVTDVRKTRIFQEALEEGREEGIEKGREKGIEEVALRLLRMERPIAEIAEATGLSPARIRKLKKKH